MSKILIATADNDLQVQFEASLRPLHPDIIISLDGTGSIEKALYEKPSLIVIGGDFKDMNSLSVIYNIHNNPLCSHIPIVVCSKGNSLDSQEKKRKLIQNARAIFLIPIDKEEFAQTCRELVMDPKRKFFPEDLIAAEDFLKDRLKAAKSAGEKVPTLRPSVSKKEGKPELKRDEILSQENASLKKQLQELQAAMEEQKKQFHQQLQKTKQDLEKWEKKGLDIKEKVREEIQKVRDREKSTIIELEVAHREMEAMKASKDKLVTDLKCRITSLEADVVQLTTQLTEERGVTADLQSRVGRGLKALKMVLSLFDPPKGG